MQTARNRPRTPRKCTPIAPVGLYAHPVCGKMQWSSVVARDIIEIPLRGAFAGRPDVPPHGEQLVKGFCFPGRCFVDRARESIGAPDLCRDITGRVCVGPNGRMLRGRQPGGRDTIAAQQHRPIHKAPSQARSADRLTEQVSGRMSSEPFTKAMALFQTRRPLALHRDQHEQACRPIYPTGPRYGRLQMECGRYASGSPPTYRQRGMAGEAPSGASGLGHGSK
jgi:hypothetical protein